MTERKIALSIEEAADYTGIGRNTLRKLVEWKKLPVLKVGRKVLIKTDIQRDIGRRENTIVPVGTVESCRHLFDSKFGVTGIMRPAYNAEIKFLVFLFFVGIVEVIQNFSEKTAFLGKRVYRIR